MYLCQFKAAWQYEMVVSNACVSALCWAWAENKGAVDSFTYGSEWCRTLSEGTVLSTYQGMMNALERWTDPMMNILWKVLHQRMKQVGGQFWRTGGWVPIAFDGSRDSAPCTESNEARFAQQTMVTGRPQSIERRGPRACVAQTIKRTNRRLPGLRCGSQ